MSDAPEPVSVITSLAYRRGDEVAVVLHLPGLDLSSGPVLMRCVASGGRRVRRPATVTATGDGVQVAGLFPVSRLRGAVWRVALKEGDGEWLPVEARLLVHRRQPVALLPGPRPKPRLAEPVPTAPTVTRVALRTRVQRRLSARLHR